MYFELYITLFMWLSLLQLANLTFELQRWNEVPYAIAFIEHVVFET